MHRTATKSVSVEMLKNSNCFFPSEKSEMKSMKQSMKVVTVQLTSRRAVQMFWKTTRSAQIRRLTFNLQFQREQQNKNLQKFSSNKSRLIQYFLSIFLIRTNF